MLVYRVERDDNHHGPWSGGMASELRWHWGHRHRLPFCEFSGPVLDKLYEVEGRGVAIHGFASRQQMRRVMWPGEVKTALTEDDRFVVALYDVDPDDAAVGDKQTVFRADRAKRLRTFRL
jgi:hypothetical protein